jgi:hypothetical protein
VLGRCAREIFQKPLCRVFDVGGPFTQVFIFDLRDGLEVLLEDDPDGVFRDISFFANLSFDLLDNGGIFENQTIDVEDRPLFF